MDGSSEQDFNGSTGHTETVSGPREAKAPEIRRTRRPLLTMPSGVQCSRTELDQHTTIDDSVYEQWLSDTETVVRLHSFDLMFLQVLRCFDPVCLQSSPTRAEIDVAAKPQKVEEGAIY